MTKVEEGEEDGALPINRVDLLPRQFVRSHFGTLLEERLLSSQQDREDKKGNKARMVEAAAPNTVAASYSDHDNDPYQMDCHFQRKEKLPPEKNHIHQQPRNALKMNTNHQITME